MQLPERICCNHFKENAGMPDVRCVIGGRQQKKAEMERMRFTPYMQPSTLSSMDLIENRNQPSAKTKALPLAVKAIEKKRGRRTLMSQTVSGISASGVTAKVAKTASIRPSGAIFLRFGRSSYTGPTWTERDQGSRSSVK